MGQTHGAPETKVVDFQTIDLSAVPIRNFPQNVEELNSNVVYTITMLITLSVSYKQLIALPHEIGTLSNLTVLNGESSQHSHTESHTLTSLFTVCNNQLTSLPHEIGTLSNLTLLFGESSQHSHTESHSNITVHSVFQPVDIIAS